MLAKRRMSVDIETYSDVNLRTHGVYLYVNSPKFEVIIISFKFEDCKDMYTIDMTKLDDPENASKLKFFKSCLMNDGIVKVAYNATFERVCLSKYFGIDYAIKSWTCTLVKGARGAMPIGLGQISNVLDVETKKDAKGAKLIQIFSVPSKTTGERTYPTTPELKNQWADYISYNIDDVLAEMDVNNELDYVRVPVWQELLYQVDQRINDRGVKIDMEFIAKVTAIMEIVNKDNFKKSFLASGVINPKSTKQVKTWLEGELNETLESTDAKTLESLLERPFLPEHISEFIFAKLGLSKSSIAKFDKMKTLASPIDSRARGLFQFYGAVRTGRWAGRAIQLQNLPRISIKGDLSTWRNIVKNSSPECAMATIDLIHGNVPYFCSQMIRPSFIPEKGNSFVIADFSQIESRVLAWMAGESWKVEAFRKKDLADLEDPNNTIPDVYEAGAATMFGLDINDHKLLKEYRQRGKVGDLAGGYQGGVQAFIRMGIKSAGITEDKEIDKIKVAWRDANPNIRQFWYDVQKAAINAIKGIPSELNGIKFFKRKGCLVIKLLSGRELYYPRASVRKEFIKALGKEADQIHYWGLDGYSKAWLERSTYGGSLVENIIQATACDLLGWCMMRCDALGMQIVIHVHDEVVIECLTKNAKRVMSKVLEIMAMPVKWAEGLSLKGEAKISQFYTK